MALTVSVNVHSGKVMSVQEAAYVAGLIDGEGTIGLWVAKPAKVRRHVLVAHLDMANTNRLLLERVVTLCGNGRISVHTKRPQQKAVYKWGVTSRQVAHLLPQIAPHLVAKRRQAELVLRFLELQRDGRRVGGRGVLDADWPEVEAIYQEIRQLNFRGDHEAPPADLTPDPHQQRSWTCDVEGCEHHRYATYAWCYKHWLEQREPIAKQCEWCEQPFNAILPHARFCSPQCQSKAARLRREGKGEKRVFACPVCHKPVVTTDPRKLTCGTACYSKMKYQERKESGYFERRKQQE